MPKAPSLAGRVLLALALMVGFYVLAIGIALLLFALPVLATMGRATLPFKLLAFCIVIGAMILWSIVPRPDRFQEPGPRLLPERHSRLFAVLTEVAAATNQAMPSEVFLVSGVNAWVTERGGIMGFGSRRVMGLGLPLLQALTIPELRAVIAHEFGHYYGGDTRLGPWVYKTRAAIGRTIETLHRNAALLKGPFIAYGKLFLRITLAVSRRQEFTADALAARTVGARHLETGLGRIHGAALAYTAYWNQEVDPVLRAGFVPPIARGFGHFLTAPGVVDAVSKSISDEIASTESDPFATHPPLRERLEALREFTEAGESGDDKPALMLLEEPEALEHPLLARIVLTDYLSRLKPVAWEDVGLNVWKPFWERVAQQEASAFAGVTVEAIPALARAPGALAERLAAKGAPDEPDHVRAMHAMDTLALMLAAAVARLGKPIRGLPGEPFRFEMPGGMLDTFAAVRDMVEGRLSPVEWRGLCAEVGISGLLLSEAVAGASDVEPLAVDGEEGAEVEPPEGSPEPEASEAEVLIDGPDDLEETGDGLHTGIEVKECSERCRKMAEKWVRAAFRRGGPGFAYEGLFAADVVCGPLLWAAIRDRVAWRGPASSAVRATLPASEVPMSLRRISPRPPADPPDALPPLRPPRGSVFVEIGEFEDEEIGILAEILAQRYPAKEEGRLAPLTARDFRVRSVSLGREIEQPIWMLELGGARLLLQFNDKARLMWVDDYTAERSAQPGAG